MKTKMPFLAVIALTTNVNLYAEPPGPAPSAGNGRPTSLPPTAGISGQSANVTSTYDQNDELVKRAFTLNDPVAKKMIWDQVSMPGGIQNLKESAFRARLAARLFPDQQTEARATCISCEIARLNAKIDRLETSIDPAARERNVITPQPPSNNSIGLDQSGATAVLMIIASLLSHAGGVGLSLQQVGMSGNLGFGQPGGISQFNGLGSRGLSPAGVFGMNQLGAAQPGGVQSSWPNFSGSQFGLGNPSYFAMNNNWYGNISPLGSQIAYGNGSNNLYRPNNIYGFNNSMYGGANNLLSNPGYSSPWAFPAAQSNAGFGYATGYRPYSGSTIYNSFSNYGANYPGFGTRPAPAFLPFMY